MRINMGVSAYASTGEKSNVVDRVIVEPGTWTATHLVIAKGSGLAADKLVPVDMIESSTSDRVTLRLSLADVKGLPDYIPVKYSAPRRLLPRLRRATGKNLPAREIFTQEGIPFGPGMLPHESKSKDTPTPDRSRVESGPIQLRDGEDVEATDGRFGTLDQLLLDLYTNSISSLVVQRGGQHFDVPVEWVAYIDPDRIRLAATQEQAQRLVGPPAGNYLSESPDQGEPGTSEETR